MVVLPQPSPLRYRTPPLHCVPACADAKSQPSRQDCPNGLDVRLISVQDFRLTYET